MEKLKIHKNGQWSLEKMAWGSPTYDLTNHGNNPYSKEERIKHQNSVLAHIQKNGYKTKEVDGKIHVLAHRGIYDLPDEGVEINPKSQLQNQYNFENNKTIKASGNTIHTLSREHADGEAMHGEATNGISHSFWVPIDKVIGHESSIDSNSKHEKDAHPDHIAISPGEYNIQETRHFTNDNIGYEQRKPNEAHWGTKNYLPNKVMRNEEV